MLEKHIEEVLFENPNLIDNEVEWESMDRQQTFGPYRLDLIGQVGDQKVIIEIKKVPITEKEINQLKGYIDFLHEKHNLWHNHYLIGKLTRNLPVKSITHKGYVIKILQIGYEIPSTMYWSKSEYRFLASHEIFNPADCEVLKFSI